MPAKKWRDKWVADFTFDGERIRKVSPVQSRRGAEAYEVELKNSLTSTPSSASPVVLPAEAPADSPFFGKFAREWLSTYAVVNNKPSEVVGKEVILRLHLIPFFEKQRLGEISARDIERYKAEKMKEKRVTREVETATGTKQEKTVLSKKTINNHLTVLRKLLVTAEEWGLISALPKIKKLSASASKFDWLTREETAKFLLAIETHYPQWKALFYLALRTGLRRGELFALHWSDVDLVRGLLTVRYSVFRGKLTAPKNGRERFIPLGARTVAILKDRQGEMGKDARLVFPAETGELSAHQNHVDRPLLGALEKAELRKVRFHDLRHSFASQLVTAGRSIKEVQELLGHQSIQMTMRYAHLAPERMRDAVLVLDDAPSSPSTP